MNQLNAGILRVMVCHCYGRAVRRDGPISEHCWSPGNTCDFLLHTLNGVKSKKHELLLFVRFSHNTGPYGGNRTAKLVDSASSVEPFGLSATGWNAEYTYCTTRGTCEFREKYPLAIRAKRSHGGYIRQLRHNLHFLFAQPLLADHLRAIVPVKEDRIAIGGPCVRIVVRRAVG